MTKVLSPNKFLAPEFRVAQSQRIDNRKEALKQHLSSAMHHCNSIKDVKQYMEGKGYKVELGRGIAFTDQQMVRFKGSQVGYSLADLEKKLKQQMLLQQKQTLTRELKPEKTINQSRGVTL